MKRTRKGRPAKRGLERVRRRPVPGCPEMGCVGVLRSYRYGDTPAMQCPTCGTFFCYGDHGVMIPFWPTGAMESEPDDAA